MGIRRISIIGLVAFGVIGSAAAQTTLRTKRPLEFRLAEHEPGPQLVAAHVAGEARVLYVHPEVQLDDRDIRAASVVKGPEGRPAVQVHLRPSGVKKFNTMAKGNQFKTVAIIARGRIISAPVIDGELVDDLLDITGALTSEEASELAKTLSRSR
jgi:preprotein translocase subunit SecD